MGNTIVQLREPFCCGRMNPPERRDDENDELSSGHLGDSRIVKNLHLHCIAKGPFLLALEGIEVSKRLRVCGIAPAFGLVYAVVKERQIALDLAVEAGKNPLAL
jgi:hypothetical protein